MQMLDLCWIGRTDLWNVFDERNGEFDERTVVEEVQPIDCVKNCQT